MIIESKYKDYYDYLQGVYGRDEKVVFDRTFNNQAFYKPSYTLFDSNNFKLYYLAICGTSYMITWYKDVLYFGDEIKTIPEISLPHSHWRRKAYYLNNKCIDLSDHNTKTKANDFHNQPIILKQHHMIDEKGVGNIYNFKLSDFNINKHIPAHDMYVKLTEWLVPKEKESTQQSDIEKIESHGFDKKISFRNIK